MLPFGSTGVSQWATSIGSESQYRMSPHTVLLYDSGRTARCRPSFGDRQSGPGGSPMLVHSAE